MLPEPANRRCKSGFKVDLAACPAQSLVECLAQRSQDQLCSSPHCNQQKLRGEGECNVQLSMGCRNAPVCFDDPRALPSDNEERSCMQQHMHADHQIAFTLAYHAIRQLCSMLAAGSHLASAAACSLPRSQQPKLLRNGPATAATHVLQARSSKFGKCIQVRAVIDTSLNALAHALPHGVWHNEACVLQQFW
jgi:hypothetical protein